MLARGFTRKQKLSSAHGAYYVQCTPYSGAQITHPNGPYTIPSSITLIPILHTDLNGLNHWINGLIFGMDETCRPVTKGLE